MHMGNETQKPLGFSRTIPRLKSCQESNTCSLSVSSLLCFVPLFTSFSFSTGWFSLQLDVYDKKTTVPK